MEVGGLHSEAGLGKSIKSYLKNNESEKGMGMWLKW
jgi:hypothetical protein